MNAGVERLILNKIPICQLRSGPPGHQSDGSGKKLPALRRRKKRNSTVCNAWQRRAHAPLCNSASALHPFQFKSNVHTPTPHEQKARQNHKIKMANKSFENVANFKRLGKRKGQSWRNLERIEFRGTLLPFGPASFVFQFVIKKYRD